MERDGVREREREREREGERESSYPSGCPELAAVFIKIYEYLAAGKLGGEAFEPASYN